MPLSGTFLLAEEGVLLPGFDRGALPAVGAGDVEFFGCSENGNEEQGEFGGAFLQVMVDEPAAVLARRHSSGQVA